MGQSGGGLYDQYGELRSPTERRLSGVDVEVVIVAR